MKDRKRSICILLIIIFIAWAVWIFVKTESNPCLSVVTPKSIAASCNEEFTVDLVMSNLPNDRYPAASITVEFDNSKLEFISVKPGTMMACRTNLSSNELQSDALSGSVPVWNCDVDLSNQSGEIKTMYLDMTGENTAYCKAGFDKKTKNIVLRLNFKLKDIPLQDRKVYFLLTDVVFSTLSGDANTASLSTSNPINSLSVKNAALWVK